MIRVAPVTQMARMKRCLVRRGRSWIRRASCGPFPVAAAQVILERANQHGPKSRPFIHGADLRGSPELPRELDGRFHRVAV